MINLSFSIINPRSRDLFETIYNRNGKITENKYWEFEIYKQDHTLLDFNIDTNIVGKDHGGISILLGLLSYVVCAKIYDNRHWDYDNKKWIDHDHKDTNC
jgi:hypothetical protein